MTDGRGLRRTLACRLGGARRSAARPLAPEPPDHTQADLDRSVARRRLALAVAGLGAAGAAYLLVADPHDPAVPMPGCPTRWVTGLDCPACGGLRLVHDLLHGQVRAAAHDNLYLLACGPVLAALLGRQAVAVARGSVAPVPRPIALGLGGGAALWMAVRNRPGWPLRPTSLG